MDYPESVECPNNTLATLFRLQKLTAAWMKNNEPLQARPQPYEALWAIGVAVGNAQKNMLETNVEAEDCDVHMIADIVGKILVYCEVTGITLAIECVQELEPYLIENTDMEFHLARALNTEVWRRIQGQAVAQIHHMLADVHSREQLRALNGTPPKLHYLLRAVNKLSLSLTGRCCVDVAVHGGLAMMEKDLNKPGLVLPLSSGYRALDDEEIVLRTKSLEATHNIPAEYILKTDPPKSVSRVEVYSHLQCIYHYCPNASVCQSDPRGCIHKTNRSKA